MHATNKARPPRAAVAASAAGMGMTATPSAAETTLSVPLIRGDRSSTDSMNPNFDGHDRYPTADDRDFTVHISGGLMA
jgi:hypothetical protein